MSLSAALSSFPYCIDNKKNYDSYTSECTKNYSKHFSWVNLLFSITRWGRNVCGQIWSTVLINSLTAMLISLFKTLPDTIKFYFIFFIITTKWAFVTGLRCISSKIKPTFASLTAICVWLAIAARYHNLVFITNLALITWPRVIFVRKCSISAWFTGCVFNRALNSATTFWFQSISFMTCITRLAC